jgi:hypothetical protein
MANASQMTYASLESLAVMAISARTSTDVTSIAKADANLVAVSFPFSFVRHWR